MRKTFADSMIELARKDEKLVVLIGDISHHLLRDFEKEFPRRFYNVGICEQAMVGLAAGLAMEGYRPVVHTIAPFCVERAYEQIKVDLCYQILDVTIISVGASFDYAHLGCTHHCYEDVSILRPLPNIDIFVPGNSQEFRDLLEDSWANGRPKYFKLTKDVHSASTGVRAYECALLNLGTSRKAIFANGHLLQSVLDLPNWTDHTVVYSPTVEPMSPSAETLISRILRSHDLNLVIEENSSSGAYADKIFDIASKNTIRVLIKKLGIPRKFCENYGSASDHRERLGLTTQNLQEMISAPI